MCPTFYFLDKVGLLYLINAMSSLNIYIQWNLGITNDFPVIVKYMEKYLDITKPR